MGLTSGRSYSSEQAEKVEPQASDHQKKHLLPFPSQCAPYLVSLGEQTIVESL